jgi:hypothetical protein
MGVNRAETKAGAARRETVIARILIVLDDVKGCTYIVEGAERASERASEIGVKTDERYPGGERVGGGS